MNDDIEFVVQPQIVARERMHRGGITNLTIWFGGAVTFGVPEHKMLDLDVWVHEMVEFTVWTCFLNIVNEAVEQHIDSDMFHPMKEISFFCNVEIDTDTGDIKTRAYEFAFTHIVASLTTGGGVDGELKTSEELWDFYKSFKPLNQLIEAAVLKMLQELGW